MATTPDSELLRAIADKRLVEFVYKTGRTRLAEPHDYGIRQHHRDWDRLFARVS